MPGEVALGESPHDQAMIAKVETAHNAVAVETGQQAPAAEATPPVVPPKVDDKSIDNWTKVAAPTKPEGVPEKFWNAATGVIDVAGMAKSYTELEKSKAPAAAPAAAPEGAPAETPPAAPAKVDFAALAQQVQADGQLNEASLAQLAGVGIDRTMAEQYVAGQQALARERDNEGIATAGGPEAFSAMQQWAGANYSQPEQDAFNKAVSTGTPAEMKAAIVALKSRYEGAVGVDPKLSLGQGGGGDGQAGYASRAEITAAMRDSRYAKDPAYRKSVERRIDLTDYSNLPM